MTKIDSGNAILVTAIGLLLAQGVIHLIETPEMYGEVPYLGVLFGLTLAGALVAAVGMARGASWGWLLGLATAGGPLLGYVLSRSIGIPGLRENNLASILEPLGLACVIAEVLFVVLAAWVLVGGKSQSRRLPAEAPAR
ncbi:MAG TPA: hypothetical protein VFU81_07045 [Thermomicrobiales bacterium]|nr:hypothetical protein [Thermomicrobiales bacterium]